LRQNPPDAAANHGQQRLTTLQLLLDALHAELMSVQVLAPAMRIEPLVTNSEPFCSKPEDETVVRALLLMVVIDLAADENAQEIFETLSARGVQLSTARWRLRREYRPHTYKVRLPGKERL
jgi:hypothetical protein